MKSAFDAILAISAISAISASIVLIVDDKVAEGLFVVALLSLIKIQEILSKIAERTKPR